MLAQLIGRKEEINVLNRALASNEAEMISVIGRRRVGKTYLIDTIYGPHMAFAMSGLQHANEAGQLLNFNIRMNDYFPAWNKAPATNWLNAFADLNRALVEVKVAGKKQVVFFDEVPWMATHKSDFLTGLSFFWNSYASKKDIVVVICGSAASWMIKKILRNSGGLHNRVTKRIRLEPFNLAETKAFLDRNFIRYSQEELLRLYMVMGGVPHYLKEIVPGESVPQAINRICFQRGGLLRDEFKSLYPSLFDQSEYHVRIVRALAKTQQGYTRSELLKATKMPDGGRVSTVLEELYESGFITPFNSFGKKVKGRRYRLTDHYSIFYLRFIEPHDQDKEGVWQALSQTASYKSWCGYGFENVCLYHLPQIKKALGVSGIYVVPSTFYHKAADDILGAQIDLVLDRNDGVINLVEMKFSVDPFTLSKAHRDAIQRQQAVFQHVTKTRKRLSPALIAASGIDGGARWQAVFDAVFDAGILFEE